MLATVPDEFSLQLAARSLDSAGIDFKTFEEPDLGGRLTALATAPVRAESRKLFRKYPLLREA